MLKCQLLPSALQCLLIAGPLQCPLLTGPLRCPLLAGPLRAAPRRSAQVPAPHERPPEPVPPERPPEPAPPERPQMLWTSPRKCRGGAICLWPDRKPRPRRPLDRLGCLSPLPRPGGLPCLHLGLASRVPTPPTRWICYGAGRAYWEGGIMPGF